MSNPIPEKSLMHCAVMFSDRENCTSQFLEAVRSRCPDFDDSQSNWTSISEPRPLAYGPLEWNGWRWQIVLDLAGLIPPARDLLKQAARGEELGRIVSEHPIAALIFLVDAPVEAEPMDCVRALCRMGWAYLDAGATAIAFPEGRTVWSRDQVRDLDPNLLDATHTNYFVGHSLVGTAGGCEGWIRTWGMHQFGLADVACPIGGDVEEPGNTQAEAAEQLMSLVPPYLVDLGDNIADGDTIEIYESLWRVSLEPEGMPGMSSPCGLSVFTIEPPVVA